jgi:aryl-alcohol dehydrogenase-like predicted oxidoreductase
MNKIQLGHSDLHVTPICLGTMTFGEQNTEADGHAQLDYALSHGINFIDTAELYPVMARAETYGSTERIIGSWLAKNPAKRKDIVLASKVAGPARGWQWIRGGGSPDRKSVVEACDASLKRLQTDCIDLYQIHWPSRNIPLFGTLYFDPAAEREVPSIHEVLEGMAELVKAGKIRYLGLSNETPWGVMEFSRLAQLHGLPRVTSVQNAYSLLNRHVENGLDEVCFREQVGVLAYSPLAFGRLTGKYDKGGFDKDGKAVGRLTHFPPTWSPRYGRPESVIATRRYMEIAHAYGLTPTQLAIAFCVHKPCIASTIVGATSVAQLGECLDSAEVVLKPDVLQAIDAVRWDMRDPAQ